MRIDIATLFPDMCERVVGESIIGRARRAGKIDIFCHHIRDYTLDKHRRCDDSPYGGGMGLLMTADPLFRCCEAVAAMDEEPPHVIYLSPKGRVFDQQKAVELSKKPRLLLVCGHYEGVDERFLEEAVDEEISIGDFVMTGGELAALAVTDAVARLCDGVLSSDECYMEESHYDGLLEYPHYTRPPVWHGLEVPPVLLTGDHGKIARWRRKESLRVTRKRRPDLLAQAMLSDSDHKLLSEIAEEEREEEQRRRAKAIGGILGLFEELDCGRQNPESAGEAPPRADKAAPSKPAARKGQENTEERQGAAGKTEGPEE